MATAIIPAIATLAGAGAKTVALSSLAGLGADYMLGKSSQPKQPSFSSYSGPQMIGPYPAGYNASWTGGQAPAATNNTFADYASMWGAPEAPSEPSEYIMPEGRYYRSGNSWIWEDNAATKSKKSEIEGLRTKYLGLLEKNSPERVKQIEDFGKKYQETLLKNALPELQQSLIGRGLGGEEMAKASATLTADAADKAVMAKEDLAQADRTSVLNALSLLDSSGNAAATRSAYSASQAANQSSQAAQLADASKRSTWSNLLQQWYNTNALNQSSINAQNQLAQQKYQNQMNSSQNLWSGLSGLTTLLPFFWSMNKGGFGSRTSSYGVKIPSSAVSY